MTALNVNGRPVEVDVESRRLLVDVVRDELGPTGTTVGCGHGVCGSCTVSIDGVAQRSCLVFAVQCEGSRSEPSKDLPHRTARCTPGFLMLLAGALDANPDLDQDEEALTAVLASNLCRCTGYVSIRAAAQQAAAEMRRSGQM